MKFTLDGYAARTCVLKTHHQFHPGFIRPEESPPNPLLEATRAFQAGCYAQILAGSASVADLRPLTSAPSPEQEAACLQAIAAGTQVIIGARLPRDWDGHRAGGTSLLLRNPDGGYHPGLVKNHRVLEPRRDDLPFEFSELSDLTRRQTTTGQRYRWRTRWPNALQLAHLWRLLETHGLAAAGPATGFIIGNDPTFSPLGCWLDLTEPACPPGSGAPSTDLISALERYDQEFAIRVEIAEQAARAAVGDRSLLLPVVHRECAHCEWWPQCQLLLDPGDLSLQLSKPSLDPSEIAALRDLGVNTVSDLASQDLAELLEDYLPLVPHRPGAEARLELAWRRSGLLAAGIALERVNTGQIKVPTAELELDLDIETSRDNRVYLWGFWVSGLGREPYYQQFSSFTDLDETAETALATQAMSWLREMVAGRSALVFHYSDYEVKWIRQLSERGGEPLAWASQFTQTHFVDLHRIVKRHFFGPHGLGLKVVAGAGPGFEWRDEDPGGLNSMTWFDEATHDPSLEKRKLARKRILDYNEDDVRATWALRGWLHELDATSSGHQQHHRREGHEPGDQLLEGGLLDPSDQQPADPGAPQHDRGQDQGDQRGL